MAANPRGSMRPNGRSPPFLAIGLCVALVILGFNYWSLSARNGEQSNEIALMESELRLVNAKKTSSEKRGEALSDKVADLEKEISSQKEVIANKMAEIQTLKQEREECSSQVNNKEGEKAQLRENLDLCETEKTALQTDIEQLKGDAESLKNRQCSESDCNLFIQKSRELTLKEISEVAGNAPLVALYKNGGNVGVYADQLKELAAAAVPINNGANMPAGQNSQQQQQQGQNPVVPNPDDSINGVDNKDSGVPQPGVDKPIVGDVAGDRSVGGEHSVGNDVNGEQTGNRVDDGTDQGNAGETNNDDNAGGQADTQDTAHQNEANHTVSSFQTKQTTMAGHYIGNNTESTTTKSANIALTNSTNGDGLDKERGEMYPSDGGDGTRDDTQNEADFNDEEDDDLDNALRVNDQDEDEDYDYDEADDDAADTDAGYRYQDEDEDNDVNNNDNNIDKMFQGVRQDEQQ